MRVSAEAQACSNIALIKYMGKSDLSANQASNPSLSYTLPHLISKVRVSAHTENQWRPLQEPGYESFDLSQGGQQRFLSHAERLKKLWDYNGELLIESGNNFPADCGVASSASSFAALTMAMAKLLQRPESALELAQLSRLASGSSCRSFFGPWTLWQGDRVESVDIPYPHLLHLLVLVDSRKKLVSSSEAHKKVPSSPQFAGRGDRVAMRMEKLIGALRRQDWPQAFTVTWDEFEDMHKLFETSEPPFSYRGQETFHVLEDCKKVWAYKKDGPLVTMDAGANVHLMFRPEQEDIYDKMKTYFSNKFKVLGSA